jgi:hypothetical protein
MDGMSVQLAFGVMNSPDSHCWLPVPGGTPLPATDREGAHPPGAPVAVGPADATPEAVREATEQLTLLVNGGTETAAGAGVDLGDGFVSARLAGAPGDRRDAVLAALQFFGTGGAHRLGDRTAVLVALFGLAATKRVGAAANTAMVEERWAAVRLASSASDLLGPEQLERVLELQAPDGIDPFPRGTASTLADHLSRVLARYPRPRRLTLVVSLWDHVCAGILDRQRFARLVASQTRIDRLDRLRERHRTHLDAGIVQQVTWSIGRNPTVAAAARWRPPPSWAAGDLRNLLHDAIAATALLRFAKTMSADGLETAMRRHHDELVAADACLTDAERTAASRRPEGAYRHPARPGRYVHDLLHPGRRFTAKVEAYVKERVAMARNYGVVVLDTVTELFDDRTAPPLHNCWDTCKPWHVPRLRQWRAATGFHRSPDTWEQPPLADAHPDGPKDTLAQRIAGGGDPVAAEAPHDLLWFADLADALAPFSGHETATVRYERPMPDVDHNPPAPPPDPSRPHADSVPLAAAGVAQLVAFGATPPPRCGRWAELVEAVTADAVVTEASVGTFPMPPGMADVDGQIVPGTELTVELGRDPRKLAEWSGYMGNCIGQSWYAEDAERGDCVLMALRTDGRIVANLDIRGRAGGWRVNELLARFNEPVDPALAEHVTRWVGTLTPREPVPGPTTPEPPVRTRGGAPRGTRLPTALVRALTAEVAGTLATVTAARRVYAVLASNLGKHADFEPEAAVIALKRLGPAQYVELLRTSLATGQSAAALWRASGVRPLATAVARLESDRVAALAEDAPLPRTLRALVRRPEFAPAYAMAVVARATRTAMGALRDDEALTRSVARRPTPELVCALVIATTCDSTVDTVRLTTPGTTTVPGYPATDVLDEHGPWQQALPAAADLGAPVATFETAVAERGLHAPATLLGKGGWPALWSRAHR